MNQTNPKPVAPASSIRPSAHDPIAQWLDVFTRLLGLPEAERQSIRDELEDHLRNRVDDLMIFGMTENEAVQRAVAELGETADLAKRFKAARTSTRRRILMHTALFTIAGLALTFGIIGMNPQTNRGVVPALSQGVAAVQPEDANISSHPRLEFDLEAGPLDKVLADLSPRSPGHASLSTGDRWRKPECSPTARSSRSHPKGSRCTRSGSFSIPHSVLRGSIRSQAASRMG